ncbi:MAG: hypothetical protein CMC68_01340 [Flavobacteriaceae bacterium]|nr:hypothetical protein [Flavobacteriaceae bacterium]
MIKKITFLILICFVVFSCKKDDDTVDACLEITNVIATNITTSIATINWTDPNGSDSYIVEYGESGFVLGSGTMVVETMTSTTLSNLNPETTYDVYVQAVCSTNNSSLFSDVLSFTTETLPVVPEFRPNLSELNLFSGNLGDLNI